MNVSDSPRPCSLTIVGDDLARIMSIGIAVQSLYNAYIVHTATPISAALSTVGESGCTVVRIRSRDSIVDLRKLIAAARPSSLLFLADTLPLKPSAARLIRTSGHAVLPERESAVVIDATVIGLLVRSEVIT